MEPTLEVEQRAEERTRSLADAPLHEPAKQRVPVVALDDPGPVTLVGEVDERLHDALQQVGWRDAALRIGERKVERVGREVAAADAPALEVDPGVVV